MQRPQNVLRWVSALTVSFLCLTSVPAFAASPTFTPDAWFQGATAGSAGNYMWAPSPAATTHGSNSGSTTTSTAAHTIGDGFSGGTALNSGGLFTWGASGSSANSSPTPSAGSTAPAASGSLSADGGSYGPGTGTPANLPSQAADIISWTNATRAQHGMPKLAESPLLDRVALAKCQDMVNNNYFGHQSPTYGSPLQMQQAFGVQARIMGAENIAGARDASLAYFMLVNSPGHLANILYNGLTNIGAAVVPLGVYGVYVCQEFTGN